MTVWHPDGALARNSTRIVRGLRLTTGLILFSDATCHLLNHSFGIRSIAAMQAASEVLLAPWQTTPGLWLLYGAFITHASLGLFALYRRRHLRMPAAEAWQLALGLCIPLLVIPHAAGIRIGLSIYGLDYDFARVVHAIWDSPLSAARQYSLLLVLWVHGCIGLRAGFAAKPWYPRAASPLAALALLVPVLALIGFTNAGLDTLDAVQRDPGLAAKLAIGPPGTPAGAHLAAVQRITAIMSWSYVGLVGATLALRLARDWHARRFRAVRIGYPGGRTVTVPLGFTILEASRWAAISHASVCGGRGRCSTCRVRIVEGADELPPPGEAEVRTLARIGNPMNVRLACQVRPRGDVRVDPLVQASDAALTGAVRFHAAAAGGVEMEVAALFVDLREFYPSCGRPAALRRAVHLRPLHPGHHLGGAAQWRPHHQHRGRRRDGDVHRHGRQDRAIRPRCVRGRARTVGRDRGAQPGTRRGVGRAAADRHRVACRPRRWSGPSRPPACRRCNSSATPATSPPNSRPKPAGSTAR